MLVAWVCLQVLLLDVQGLELLHGVVVVGNLREGEALLVDVTGVHKNWDLLKSVSFQFLIDLNASIEMLLVQGDAELVQFLVHLLDESDSLVFVGLLVLSILLGLFCLGSSFLLSLFLKLLCFFSLLSLLLGLLSFLASLLSLLLLSNSFGLSLFLFVLLLCLCSLLGHLLMSLGLAHFSLDLLLRNPNFLHFENLLGLHLLLDFQHLELSLGLSALELMLSLQTSEVRFRGSLLRSCSFRLLNGLSSKEVLLKSFSF